MATLTITKFPAATALAPADEFLVMQGTTTTKKGTVAQITTAQAGVSALQSTSYSTRTALMAVNVPTGVTAVQTNGYAAVGDGGGALYKYVASVPSHPGYIQSADGAYWEMVEASGNIRAFGADGTGATNCTSMINDAIAYCKSFTPYRPLYIPTGKYKVVTTPTVIPTEFTIYGDGPRNSVLIPGMTDGTSCLKFYSGTEGTTLKDFGISTYSNFANFITGTANPNCIGIEADIITTGHTTRYCWTNLWVDGCRTGVKIDGWIGTITNLFLTANDKAFTGKELNGVTLNLVCENNRQDFTLDDCFALTMMTLQSEGDVYGQLASTVNSCHGVTFINPYWEAGTVYPRAYPYMTIGDFYIAQNVSIIGGMAETINLPRTVPPIDVIWLDGGTMEVYCSVGSTGSGIGLGVRVMNTAYNVIVKQSNGLGTYAYQDFSWASSPDYNYFPNPFFEVWLRGYDKVTLNHATLAADLSTWRRGHKSAKVTATVGTNTNYVDFEVPSLKLIYTSMYSMTLRVGAWVYIPDITEYNDGTLDKIPDISIYWVDGSAVTHESTTTHPGTIATGTWCYVYALVTPLDTVTKIGVRLYSNRTTNNATGNELVYFDSVTIMHASVALERQMRESFMNCEYLPTFVQGRLQALGNSVPTDTNQVYERGDTIFIQEPDAYTSPGWICTGAGAGGSATWSSLPATEGRGLVSAMPSLAGTLKGARYYATNGRNSGEGAGAGTGCWATLNNAGGWIADWSGVTITD